MRVQLVRIFAVASLVLAIVGMFSSAHAANSGKLVRAGMMSPDADCSLTLLDSATAVGGSETGPAPAPLKEILASHDGHGVTLSWRSSAEADAHFYHVLRSVDGKSFEQIAQLEGLSTRKHKLFAYLDRHPPVGSIQYRIDVTTTKGVRGTAGTVTVKVIDAPAVSQATAQP